LILLQVTLSCFLLCAYCLYPTHIYNTPTTISNSLQQFTRSYNNLQQFTTIVPVSKGNRGNKGKKTKKKQFTTIYNNLIFTSFAQPQRKCLLLLCILPHHLMWHFFLELHKAAHNPNILHTQCHQSGDRCYDLKKYFAKNLRKFAVLCSNCCWFLQKCYHNIGL
jgi:hypothetical protein